MTMPNMQELMEKAKEMQKQMQVAQQEITSITVIGKSGGGLVEVHMSGAYRVLRTIISEKIISDKAMTEDLVTAAFNHASDQVASRTKDKMMQLAKTLNLPENTTDQIT